MAKKVNKQGNFHMMNKGILESTRSEFIRNMLQIKDPTSDDKSNELEVTPVNKENPQK